VPAFENVKLAFEKVKEEGTLTLQPAVGGVPEYFKPIWSRSASVKVDNRTMSLRGNHRVTPESVPEGTAFVTW
jgi:hypothetical protein